MRYHLDYYMFVLMMNKFFGDLARMFEFACLRYSMFCFACSDAFALLVICDGTRNVGPQGSVEYMCLLCAC